MYINTSSRYNPMSIFFIFNLKTKLISVKNTKICLRFLVTVKNDERMIILDRLSDLYFKDNNTALMD